MLPAGVPHFIRRLRLWVQKRSDESRKGESGVRIPIAEGEGNVLHTYNPGLLKRYRGCITRYLAGGGRTRQRSSFPACPVCGVADSCFSHFDQASLNIAGFRQACERTAALPSIPEGLHVGCKSELHR